MKQKMDPNKFLIFINVHVTVYNFVSLAANFFLFCIIYKKIWVGDLRLEDKDSIYCAHTKLPFIITHNNVIIILLITHIKLTFQFDQLVFKLSLKTSLYFTLLIGRRKALCVS